MSKRVSLLKMAGLMANKNTVDIIEHVAMHHPCKRTRLQAFGSLAQADPENSERYKRLASDDASAMVRSFATSPFPTSSPRYMNDS